MSRQIWFAVFGPQGLASVTPLEAHYNEGTSQWSSVEGQFRGGYASGLEMTQDRCVYTHSDRDQVVAWIRGAQAACYMMSLPTSQLPLK